MSLKKPLPASGSDLPTGTAAAAGEWSKGLPTLAEFLSALTWEDGTSREPGTMLVFSEDGAWKACLHDRTAQLQVFVSAATPGGLLAALEKGLAGGSLDWRRKKAWGGGKGKKGG